MFMSAVFQVIGYSIVGYFAFLALMIRTKRQQKKDKK